MFASADVNEHGRRDMVETWHYGLVARWWGASNEGGDDAEFFRRFVERSGGPALDVGCGAGRVVNNFVARRLASQQEKAGNLPRICS